MHDKVVTMAKPMRKINILIAAIVLVSQLFMSIPVKADNEAMLPKVVINELQTNGLGTGTTDQEFVEIKNIGQASVDLSDWKLIYTPSSGSQASSKTIVSFTSGTILDSDGVLVIAPSTYLTNITGKIIYQGTTNNILAATSGSVSLNNSLGELVDIVGWGTLGNITTLKETALAHTPSGGESIQRKLVNSVTIDTNDNSFDFETLSIPTPGIIEVEHPEEVPQETEDDIADAPEVPLQQPSEETTVPDTTETETVEPEVVPQESNVVSPTILLNEIYIDPASPETDSNDEWIELYNPNNNEIDIAGYSIYSGTNNNYKYVFTTGSKISAHGYLVVTSGESPLAFSNSGGAARLFNDEANLIDETAYSGAIEGESWARDSGLSWVWTSTPTKADTNVIKLPLPAALKVAAKKAAKKSTKKTAAKKVTKVKAAKKTVKKVKNQKTNNDFDDVALIAAPTPLPWWALAVILTLALLYVGYEYRFEFTNSIYRLKKYRANRR